MSEPAASATIATSAANVNWCWAIVWFVEKASCKVWTCGGHGSVDVDLELLQNVLRLEELEDFDCAVAEL